MAPAAAPPMMAFIKYIQTALETNLHDLYILQISGWTATSSPAPHGLIFEHLSLSTVCNYFICTNQSPVRADRPRHINIDIYNISSDEQWLLLKSINLCVCVCHVWHQEGTGKVGTSWLSCCTAPPASFDHHQFLVGMQRNLKIKYNHRKSMKGGRMINKIPLYGT